MRSNGKIITKGILISAAAILAPLTVVGVARAAYSTAAPPPSISWGQPVNAFSLGLAASSSTASAGGTVQFTVILRYAAGPSPEFTFDNDPCDVPFEVLASDSSGKAVPGFAPQTSPCSFHSGPNTLQLVKHPGHASYLAAGEKIVEVAPLSRFYPGGLPHGKITLIADRIITTPTSAFDVVSGPVTLAIGP